MEDRRLVSQDQFEGRNRLCDERFARDKERIKSQEDAMQEVRDLSIQMGEILKELTKTTGSHEKRICELERQPADQYSKVKLVIVSGLIGAIITTIVNAFMASPKP